VRTDGDGLAVQAGLIHVAGCAGERNNGARDAIDW
jgi:hypothetical protein